MKPFAVICDPLATALGMGAIVSLIDRNLDCLRELDDIFGGRVYTVASNSYTISKATQHADLVIGAVLIPGAAAPKLVTRKMVSQMKPGAVIVDVAIDQGGCIETARPTTHSDPAYIVDGVVHYCVTNMPAAVPHTSTLGSPTPRSLMSSSWHRREPPPPSATTLPSARASTPTKAASPTPPSPSPRERSPETCWNCCSGRSTLSETTKDFP